MNNNNSPFQDPKGDLHNHISLGMRFYDFKRWTKRPISGLPAFYDGLSGLRDHIDNIYKPSIKNKEDSFLLIEMGIEEAIRDDVTLLEGSIDIGTIKFFDSVSSFLERVNETIKKFEARINFKPDLGISKIFPVETAVDWGRECINSNIFSGIDLYGPEIDNDFGYLKELYKLAGDKKMTKKAHIGEFSKSESIKKMIELFELDEIQHGITAVESEDITEYLVKNKIQLNVCPASNIMLGATNNLVSHPIRCLFDRGVKLTINTDDLLFFNKSISEQYSQFIEEEVFSNEEINQLRLNSLRVT